MTLRRYTCMRLFLSGGHPSREPGGTRWAYPGIGLKLIRSSKFQALKATNGSPFEKELIIRHFWDAERHLFYLNPFCKFVEWQLKALLPKINLKLRKEE